MNLALLWGHMPRGIIQTSRHICQRYERPVPFALSRDSNTGRPARTVIHSFGSYHISTSIGPFPVSLVEMTSVGPRSVPFDVLARLHAISVGFPIVGDQLYTKHEKYHNPVIPHPADLTELALQPWYDFDLGNRRLVSPDGLSTQLLDRGMDPLSVHHSMIPADGQPTDEVDEDTEFEYMDHPRSRFVRRDRGKV